MSGHKEITSTHTPPVFYLSSKASILTFQNLAQKMQQIFGAFRKIYKTRRLHVIITTPLLHKSNSKLLSVSMVSEHNVSLLDIISKFIGHNVSLLDIMGAPFRVCPEFGRAT